MIMATLLISIVLFVAIVMVNNVQSGQVEVPLLNKLDAPLKTEIDITRLNEQLRDLIKSEVNKGFNEAIQRTVDNFNKMSKKQEEFKSDISDLVQKIQTDTQKSLKNFSITVDEMKGVLDQVASRHVGHISFSAKLKHKIPNLPPDATVIFDSVVINNGNAYNYLNGIFKAPKQGTYFFTSSILTKQPSTLEMALRVNGHSKMWLYASSSNISYNNGVNSVILNLNIGDEVKIVKSGAYGSRPFYLHSTWSTFSGFLIN